MTTEIWPLLIRGWARTLRAENKSPATIDAYTRAPRQLADWLTEQGQTTPPGDVTRAQLEEFIAAVVERTSAGNAHTTYRGLQQWHKWLIREDEITTGNPMDGMKPPIVPDKPVPVIPDDLVRRVLATCDGKTMVARRDTAIIRLLWDTGCRLSEIANLKVGDVDLDHDRITILAKGRRPRVVAFNAKAGQALTRYLRVRSGDRWAGHERLWLAEKGKGPLTANGVKLMLRRRGQAAGVNTTIGRNLHAHLGRHAFAHEWQKRGGNEGDLMYTLGWKSRAMCDRYAKSAREERAQDTARGLALGDRL